MSNDPGKIMARMIAETAIDDASQAEEVLALKAEQADEVGLTHPVLLTLVEDAYTLAAAAQGVEMNLSDGEYSPDEVVVIVALNAMEMVRKEARMTLTMGNKKVLH